MNEHCLVPRIVQGTAEVATPMESEPVAKSHGCTKLLPTVSSGALCGYMIESRQ